MNLRVYDSGHEQAESVTVTVTLSSPYTTTTIYRIRSAALAAKVVLK